ncbi:MAG: cell division protein FtsB [Gammaproteobacteria bacterium]
MRIWIVLLISLFVLLQYDLWVGEGSLATVWRLQKSIENQSKENKVLADRNKALEAEVIDLKQGKDAIEERARSDLGMIKEGETYIQIVDE